MPTGNHLIVGSADSRLAWFDLEGKDTPYRILRYPGLALRQVTPTLQGNDGKL